MSLPFVRLTGSPLEQGRVHGETLRCEVRSNLEVYFRRFALEIGLARPEVLRRAAAYAEALRVLHPAYHEGMQGVAQGSGLSFAEVAALNVRYEILYDAFGKKGRGGGVDGCTSFALTPERTADGHLLLGQNWDWVPEVRGALLHVQEAGQEHLAFTEAGIVGGKVGLNSAGLGLAINGLTSPADDWEEFALPFHARCYDVLRQRTLEAAVEVASREPRACSANFLLAQVPGKVVNLETAPHALCRLGPEDGMLVHANHFVNPLETDADPEDRLGSLLRYARLKDLLAGAERSSLGDVQTFLRDRENAPDALCRHPDPAKPEFERYATVVSVVMDLHARTLHLSDGPPDGNPYETFQLQPLGARPWARQN